MGYSDFKVIMNGKFFKYRIIFSFMRFGLDALAVTAVIILTGGIYSSNRLTPLERDIEYAGRNFKSGDYEGHKAFAGISERGFKVAKIYSRIKEDSNGYSYVDMVGAVDMNNDGRFQVDELVDMRSSDLGEILFMGRPIEKFGGTVSQFANPKSLEKIFNKLMSD